MHGAPEQSAAFAAQRHRALRRQLLVTCALIVLALVTAAPAAIWTLSEAVSAIVPICPRGIEPGPSVATPEADPRSADFLRLFVFFERERDGLTLHVDTAVDEDNRVTWARIRATDRDAHGLERECGRAALRSEGVSPQDGDARTDMQPLADPMGLPLMRGGDVGAAILLQDGSYGYLDRKYGLGAGTFRFVERPSRYLQTTRVAFAYTFNSIFALVALVASAVAVARVRRVFAYAWRRHRWVEATLREDGRIEDGHGQTLARVDDARDLAPGAVLLAPRAATAEGAYRDVPVVARRAVTSSGHATWSARTETRLHDARVLATIGIGCMVLAVLFAWRMR